MWCSGSGVTPNRLDNENMDKEADMNLLAGIFEMWVLDANS
jgi:hypothetical protein